VELGDIADEEDPLKEEILDEGMMGRACHSFQYCLLIIMCRCTRTLSPRPLSPYTRSMFCLLKHLRGVLEMWSLSLS
jgi:hypothetical protein